MFRACQNIAGWGLILLAVTLLPVILASIVTLLPVILLASLVTLFPVIFAVVTMLVYEHIAVMTMYWFSFYDYTCGLLSFGYTDI